MDNSKKYKLVLRDVLNGKERPESKTFNVNFVKGFKTIKQAEEWFQANKGKFGVTGERNMLGHYVSKRDAFDNYGNKLNNKAKSEFKKETLTNRDFEKQYNTQAFNHVERTNAEGYCNLCMPERGHVELERTTLCCLYHKVSRLVILRVWAYWVLFIQTRCLDLWL